MRSLLRKEVVGTRVMIFLALVVHCVQGQTSTIVMASSSIMSQQISHNATSLDPSPTPSLTNYTSSEQASTQSISIAGSTIMSTPTFSMIVNSSSSNMDNNSQVPTEKPADADLKNITLYLLIVCVALFLIIIIILIILVVQMKHLTNKLRR